MTAGRRGRIAWFQKDTDRSHIFVGAQSDRVRRREEMPKVIYEKRDRIGYVTLNRPESLNALDDELNDALWEVWADFGADESVDVAIVTGAGKAFCAGADLKTF